MQLQVAGARRIYDIDGGEVQHLHVPKALHAKGRRKKCSRERNLNSPPPPPLSLPPTAH